jgi:hypothetical protein
MDEPSGLAPPPAGASAVQDARVGIARSAGFLHAAHALIGQRRPLDLSGLEAEIGRLCAQVLALAPEEGRGLVPALAALCDEIDAVDAALARARSGPA